MKKEIADIRNDYKLRTLSEDEVCKDAIEQFTLWWSEAVYSEIFEVNAMTLATVKDGVPSARIVLLKDYDEKGFVFYTNYNSHKANDIANNANVALVFFWKELERQIRIEGTAEKVSNANSEAYFVTRPVKSKIGAWASPQSEVIKNRSILESDFDKYSEQFKENVPRPTHWGGYVVKPALIEFWQGRRSRLHDRILYTRQPGDTWKIERLAP